MKFRSQKILVGILIVLLSFFNISLIFKVSILNRNQKLRNKEETLRYTINEKRFKNLLDISYQNINPDAIISNSQSSERFKERIGNKLVLIFYYSEKNCQECVIEEVNKINSFFPERLKDKVLLVRKQESENQILNIGSRFSNHYWTCDTINEQLEKNLINTSYYFLLDSGMTTQLTHFSNKNSSNYTILFLSKVREILDAH